MKRILILTSLVVALVGFWGFSMTDTTPEDERLLLTVMAKVLNENHYNKLKYDDAFSARVFDLYIKRMDYNKMYFLQRDIDDFQEYRNRLDEDIPKSDISFYKAVNKVYNKRFEEAEKYVNNLLEGKFDFNVKETYESDPEKRTYCESEKELKEIWRKYLKYTVLNSYLGKLENQEKAREKGVGTWLDL